MTSLDALGILQDYIRIDTTNPPGAETEAAEFLAEILEGVGIDVTILTDPDGRPNLVARVRGDGPPGDALCLLHHMDVVPAEADEWSVEPFAAEVRDGFVWGRGALDTKGLGVMQLVALAQLKTEEAPLARDIVYVANADEEAGGAHGAGWLCSNYADLVACQWVLNEGGFGVSEVLPGVSTFGVAVSEKAIVWLRLLGIGRPGHGSTPHDDQALEHLLAALREISEPRPLRITPVVAEGFLAVAERAPGPIKGAVEELFRSAEPTTVPLTTMLPPGLQALLRDTITVTNIHAGYKENVIPGKAEAIIDCRLLPDTDADAFIAEITATAKRHRVDVEVILRGEPHGIDRDAEMLGWIRAAAAEHVPEVLVSETICPGFTDSRFFRQLGARCIGLTPALVTSEVMAGFHGIDERLPVDGLDLGVRMVRSIIERACRPAR